MAWVTAQYTFRQPFRFSVDRAFRWCIDFQPGDLALENEKGRRKVRWFSGDLLVLTDTFVQAGRRPTTKTKLVRLRRPQHAWTSTHLAGPNRYSQFWYEILPDGKSASHLEFKGLHVERRPGAASPTAAANLARRLKREDSSAWRLLAAAMETDLR